MTQRPGVKTLSAAAVACLMLFEGFRSMPYRDIAGVWTDGYGNTHGVVPGVAVSEPVARARLVAHVDVFGTGVLKCLNREPTQGQYDAFVLMAYNTGLGKAGKADGFCEAKRGGPSTLVRRYNAGDEGGACLAMLRWVNAGGAYSRGLFNRRWQEYNMCLDGTYTWNAGGVR